MTLSFSQKWGDKMGDLSGKPSHFVAKILNSFNDKDNYYPFVCVNCGFKGMSMLLDNIYYSDDSDCYCPKCKSAEIDDFEIGLEDYYMGKYPKKIHTIREDKANRWRAGKIIHFVINNRTKDRFQFAPVVKCQRVQKIHIKIYKSIEYDMYGEYSGIETNREVWVDDFFLSKDATRELAINDGFPDTNSFFDFFENGFIGKIIHWTDKKY